MTASTNLPSWADAAASKQLPELSARGESQSVEFKRCLPDQGHDIGKSVAAFASTNAGILLYGVCNDGRIIGIADAHESEVRDDIAQRVVNAAKQVRPPVHPKVSWAYCDGKAVCVVEVERGVEALYYSNQRPIVRRGSTSRPAEPSEVEQVFRSRYTSLSTAAPLPSTRGIAQRMSDVLAMMNKERWESLAVSDLALAMGLTGPAELESVLIGQIPPTFAVIDLFCSRFAVNKEWVTTGRSTPFLSQVERRALPEQYLGLIDEAKCEVVYAVRSKSDIGESFLVVESDPLKIWLLPDVWHVSDHVGGGGSRDLVSLCALFTKWSSGHTPYSVLGREVEPALAESIWNGQTFPGVVEHMPLSHWWDDLTDLSHRWTTQEGSRRAYGKQFVAAQDIIRKMLSR